MGTVIIKGILMEGNPYGYRVNISHPQIAPLYERFRKWKKIQGPMSDAERFEFERYILEKLEKGGVGRE